MRRFSRLKCCTPSSEVRWLSETSKVLRFVSSCKISDSKRYSLLLEMFRTSKVVGNGHICSIWLPAIDNFFKKIRRCSSLTSFRSWFPLTSSSVRFLNFYISFKAVTPRPTNLKVIKEGGFLTSDKLFMAVVFELKLLLLFDRWRCFDRIDLGSFWYFWIWWFELFG